MFSPNFHTLRAICYFVNENVTFVAPLNDLSWPVALGVPLALRLLRRPSRSPVGACVHITVGKRVENFFRCHPSSSRSARTLRQNFGMNARKRTFVVPDADGITFAFATVV